MTATKFTLPKNKSAIAMLPPEIRALVDSAAEGVKGKPWAAVYHAAVDFHKIMMMSHGNNTLNGSEIEIADRWLRLMITALLERLAVKVKCCSDPFQAAVFIGSARKDHRRMARQYFKKVGGQEAVNAQMEAWAKEHRDELESIDTGVMIQGMEIEGDGPKSLDATLEEWTEKARERFDADGEVHPLAVGLNDDGSGLMLTTYPVNSIAKKRGFRQMAGQQLNERGLTRFVAVGEVWVGSVGLVNPSKSNVRREAIFVRVSEGGETIASTIPIERDWQTGKGFLGATEKATHVMFAYFDGI